MRAETLRLLCTIDQKLAAKAGECVQFPPRLFPAPADVPLDGHARSADSLQVQDCGKGLSEVFLTVLFDATQLIPYLLISCPLPRKVPRLPCEPRIAWAIQKGWKGIGISV
jgi:hypothetical protein